MEVGGDELERVSVKRLIAFALVVNNLDGNVLVVMALVIGLLIASFRCRLLDPDRLTRR